MIRWTTPVSRKRITYQTEYVGINVVIRVIVYNSNTKWGRYYILWHVEVFEWWSNTVRKKDVIELGRFEVFMVVVLKINVFRDVMPRHWPCSLWCLEGLYYLHLQVLAVQEQPFRGKRQVPPTTSSDWLATVSSHPISTAIPVCLSILFPVVAFFIIYFTLKMKTLQSCRMSWTTCPLTQCRIPQDPDLLWSNMFFCHTARSSRWGEPAVGESDGWTRIWQWWWAA